MGREMAARSRGRAPISKENGGVTAGQAKILKAYLRSHKKEEFEGASTRKPPASAVSLHAATSEGGYQAMDASQFPAPRFPTTLASFVLVFAMDEEWRTGDGISYSKMNMQPLVDKLRSADMIIRETESSDRQRLYAMVSISEKRQRQVAEIMGDHDLLYLRLKKQDDEENEVKNGGGWTVFKNHLSHLYEKSSEGTLLSSCQQCQCIEFMLNEGDVRALGPQLVQQEACEPGNTILQQLVRDERIVDFYYLHHPEKKQWLVSNWANSYLLKQPIEDVREYLGEEICMYVAWAGYVVTMLWVPAATGIFMLIMQFVAIGQSGSVDNPFMPLYATFIAVWAIMFNSGWQRLELTYQYEWGLTEWEQPDTDRREFVQNPRTYKRLNTISQKEEYYPDPLWRGIAVVAGFFVVVALIAANVFLVLFIEASKTHVEEILGVSETVANFVGALIQGALIIVARMVGDMVFFIVNSFENWKTPRQYSNALICKRFTFGLVSSYFVVFFIGFMANVFHPFGVDRSCPDSRCIDLLEMTIAVIFIENSIYNFVVKSLLPKLSRVGAAGAKLDDGEMAELAEEAVSEAELQGKLEVYGGVDDEYAEKVAEIGYLMLFGAAMPLLSVLILVSCINDLRADAERLLNGAQRPSYKRGKSIGTWAVLLDVMTIMGIISQCCFLAFTSNSLYYYFPGMTPMANAFYAIALEHALLFFKALWDAEVCGSVPEEVELAFNRKV
ncbi:calcium-activated chloride channel-domain-containing protein, partial [Baffinella frigidus]